MPRDHDKNNESRGRRDRPSGGKGRSGVARGPDKKFAKRGHEGKRDGGEGSARPYAKKPYAGGGKSYGGKGREDGEVRPRGNRSFSERPHGDRGKFNRDDRPQRSETRPTARFQDRKFGDKKPYSRRDGDEKRSFAPRGEGFSKGARARDDRPFAARSREGDAGGERPPRKFGGEAKFSRGPARDRQQEFGERDRGPRRNFGERGERRGEFSRDRSEEKPWEGREAGRKFDRPRFDRPREDRGNDERPRFSRQRPNSSGADRPRGDRPAGDRPFRERPKFDRPREDRPKFERPRRDRETSGEWQDHPKSASRSSGGDAERPRRHNEDDSKIFTKRPAFGGRGEYRERRPEFDRRDRDQASRPSPRKKAGERIAKVVARAGLASRRDAEEWITQGRVTVNGRVINSPALDVTENDVIAVDGKNLPPRERTRLFLYHKPKGLMTTHADPEGRPTVFDHLPEGLPRLISIGRLDFNTEGLLLLTNDGGLARALELPDTGWLRRYRVRAHGEVTQAQLDELQKGVEVEGVKYGPIDATLERDQGANVWLVFAIREGKNREVRNVMAHLGLEVNRLIRISYGPFQLAELAEGAVEEVKTRVLREQLGDKIAALAGADFDMPASPGTPGRQRDEEATPRGKKPFKPAGKSALINDRKGRRVLVQRTGSEEARAQNESEANGYGPPRRPKRGYHGKRDLTPRDE